MTKWIAILQNNDFLGAKQLIKAGEDINARLSETGESVLACALRYRCDDDLIGLLVENGADLYAIDNEGVSIFDNAITYNCFSLFKTILEKGIEVNQTQRCSGFTPLMAAVCYRRTEMVELLLEHGAVVETCDERHLSATDYARKMQLKSILELLESRG